MGCGSRALLKEIVIKNFTKINFKHEDNKPHECYHNTSA
jgi:hypothetical protein